MSRETAYDLAHVLRELQRMQLAGRLSPGNAVYVEVPNPAGDRPLFAATVELGQLGGPGQMPASPGGRPSASPRVYKLDRIEKAILSALGRAWPGMVTLEDLAAKIGRSVATLNYKKRIRRLQDELGLIANDNDHEGYRLTEEGERVAGELLVEEEKE